MTFSKVLQCILQDKKVRYIIGELQKREQDTVVKEEKLPEKVIICKGQTDEIILQTIAQKQNQEETRRMIVKKIDTYNYELAIINNYYIEDWFEPEVADFSKLKLIQSIDTVIENVDFTEISKRHKSFDTVIKFLQKQFLGYLVINE